MPGPNRASKPFWNFDEMAPVGGNFNLMRFWDALKDPITYFVGGAGGCVGAGAHH